MVEEKKHQEHFVRTHVREGVSQPDMLCHTLLHPWVPPPHLGRALKLLLARVEQDAAERHGLAGGIALGGGETRERLGQAHAHVGVQGTEAGLPDVVAQAQKPGSS